MRWSAGHVAPAIGSRSAPGSGRTHRSRTGTKHSKAAATWALLYRVASWLTRTAKRGGFSSRRGIGASVLRRRVAGGRPDYQRRAMKAVAIPWPKPLPLDPDPKLEGEFCKIVGGVLSPVLANVALDGIERLFGCEDRDGNPVKAVTKRGMDKSVVLIRYADDFLVTAPSKEVLERYARPKIEAFLAERGLALNQEKTRIVSIDEGFDFLGFTARKFEEGNLLIRPEKAKVLAPRRKTKASLDTNKQIPAGAVVRALTPIIRGWTMYYRH